MLWKPMPNWFRGWLGATFRVLCLVWQWPWPQRFTGSVNQPCMAARSAHRRTVLRMATHAFGRSTALCWIMKIANSLLQTKTCSTHECLTDYEYSRNWWWDGPFIGQWQPWRQWEGHEGQLFSMTCYNLLSSLHVSMHSLHRVFSFHLPHNGSPESHEGYALLNCCTQAD